MKNKYFFPEIARCYANEIGGDIPPQLIEEYLRALFSKQPIENYDVEIKKYTTNSEYFPELHNEPPTGYIY